MNILQILPELNSGGVETGTVDLAKELIRRGHKAIVISNGGSMLDKLKESGAVHYKLPVHEKNPITIISMISKIREIIREEGVDIVHARSRVPAISSFFAAKLEKTLFITTCHGHYSTHIFSRPMGWGRFVVVASNAVARHMINNFLVPRDRIRLIPRGVDLEGFRLRSPGKRSHKKEFVIGLIGRITPIKGHIYFIRAMSKVVRLMPNAKAIIIGDAPANKPKYRQELEVLVRRLSLSKYIQFLGNISDVPKKMADIDLVVMPSIGEETFGRVIIEAQAVGVPVIASKIGGMVDIIKDYENGLLVAPRDWNGLSDAIVKIIKDDRLRAKLIKNGRINVEKQFSLAHMYKKTLSLYEEAIASFSILIIKWSALGDIILSLPALKAIREKFPKAKITLLTSNSGREFLSRYNYVDDFIIFKNNKGLESIKEILATSATLRKIHIDLCLDLQNNKKSHIISFFSHASRRIGYKSNKLDFLLNEGIDGAKANMPPVLHQFKLLEALGIKSIPKSLEIDIDPEEAKYVDDLFAQGWLAKNQILVGINCGASQRWQSKVWPAEKIAKLCDLLAQKRIRVVMTGTKEETEEAKRIQILSRSKPLDFTGKSNIMQLAAVIKKCRVFITPDSAPLHIAAFLGVPFVALFGPTDPKRHLMPYGEHSVIRKDIRCAPCYKPKCSHKKCMQKIMPEEVQAAVMELLKR